MLPADPDLQVFACTAALVNRDLHQLAYAFAVKNVERINRKDLLVEVFGKETPYIIPAETKAHLGKVIGPEREELGCFSHFVSKKSGSWYLYQEARNLVRLATGDESTLPLSLEIMRRLEAEEKTD